MRHLTAVQQCQQTHIIHRPSQQTEEKHKNREEVTTRTVMCHLSALSERPASQEKSQNKH